MTILSPDALSFAGLRKNFLTATAFALALGAGAANAQVYDRPPADVPEQGGYGAPSGPSAAVRIDRLESQVRNLNGQVEQLQFQVKRLEDQLRKFQMDVDARLQDAAKPASAPAARPAAAATPQRRSDVIEDDTLGAPPPRIAENSPPPETSNPAAAAIGPDGRRHDAFDPENQPNAPGAPLPLGSADSASKQAVHAAAAPSGPLDLTPPGLRDSNDALSASPSAAAAPLPANNAAMTPALTPADPVKAEYDAAADQLKSQRYDAAQQAFTAFVQKNPHTRLIAPAIYHLGESYYYQNRHREAAEQFLKIATDYSKSSVAPDAMVKLGVSLNALGAKEQACAFFSEMPRKYPNAPPAQKLAAEREAKKASC
jgi:tol-pal system protein YbgF